MFALFFFAIFLASAQSQFLGCYKDTPTKYPPEKQGEWNSSECLHICENQYYKYALIKNESVCFCGIYPGSVESQQSCSDYCKSTNCTFKDLLSDVHFTSILVPGPPRGLSIENITETTAHISWQLPRSSSTIHLYRILANVISTYSHNVLSNPKWTFSNDTLCTELLNLQPGTKYNISVQAVTAEGEGIPSFQVIETKIGEPDVPLAPTVLQRGGRTMTVKLNPVINNNGPVNSYLIAIINKDLGQAFQKENLKSYREAELEGAGYYIAAEIPPKDVLKNFVIGDGRFYGNYYNAPLKQDANYYVIVGALSRLNNSTKIAYSNITESENGMLVFDLPQNSPSGPSTVVIILSVAIGLLSCLLVAGIVGFILLKKHVSRQQRCLNDRQELTLQGPIIEVENNGYIPEEEMTPVNYYTSLKQQIWCVPQKFLKVDPTDSLGLGKFGRVNGGTVQKDDVLLPVAVYSIQDRKLSSENKRTMLQDLDVLIRAGKHDNIATLIGTCENVDTVFVVLEFSKMYLKDFLLGSRDALPDHFSNLSENDALGIAVSIADGMDHLHSQKIFHKQLCARNVMLVNNVPKISGYGISQFYKPNMVPDYVRWTALEVFKGRPHIDKSDVWSFACLLWEICVLGGTPYGTVANNEIPDRIIRGLRLPQLQYISDDLYQVMLNCWQLDLDERPTFNELLIHLKNIKHEQQHLSFRLYPGFQYEQFYSDLELAVRTVF